MLFVGLVSFVEKQLFFKFLFELKNFFNKPQVLNTCKIMAIYLVRNNVTNVVVT